MPNNTEKLLLSLYKKKVRELQKEKEELEELRQTITQKRKELVIRVVDLTKQTRAIEEKTAATVQNTHTITDTGIHNHKSNGDHKPSVPCTTTLPTKHEKNKKKKNGEVQDPRLWDWTHR